MRNSKTVTATVQEPCSNDAMTNQPLPIGSETPPRIDATTSPLHQTTSRHVQLIDGGNILRARQRNTGCSRAPEMRSPSARSRTSGARSSIDPHSPRASISTFYIQNLLENLEIDQYDTFGAEEMRDGFFDAIFYRSLHQETGDEICAQLAGREESKSVLRTQLDDVGYFFQSAFTTRDGLMLAKAFLGYFVTYIVCLIPRVQNVLGRYSYWATIAALFNHSGRTLGAQIDGTIGCIGGGALGLAIGCLALEVASVTEASLAGYSGVLAAFMIPLVASMAWIRCLLLRFYQAMIAAGLAVIFLCLVEPDVVVQTQEWKHRIVLEFAYPWLLGLGICLIVNISALPETGSRAVATALHNAMRSALDALELPRVASLEIHSNMSKQLVDLSDAVRDMKNEVTFMPLKPDFFPELRNLLQSVIKEIMAIKPDTTLFSQRSNSTTGQSQHDEGITTRENSDDSIEVESDHNSSDCDPDYEKPLQVAREMMAEPARQLIITMVNVLHCCDSELMRIMRIPEYHEATGTFDICLSQSELQAEIRHFDEADVSLINHPQISSSYPSHPHLVELFLFMHPLRQAAGAIDTLAAKVLAISNDQESGRGRWYLPSYPFKKAIYRTNPQVRHDRGGAGANWYFRIKSELNEIMGKIHARQYVPDALAANGEGNGGGKATGIGGTADEHTLRYRMWRVFHRLQQFETRFAFKIILVTTCLSVPAWLEKSEQRYKENESWWAVIAAWFMMHPRVGGNAQDLVTRTLATVIGAVWGGFACAASKKSDSGRPYVLAIFAAVFMLPAVFRFMLSSHPRSGLMACLSFTVVSLSSHNNKGSESSTQIAWTRGLALATGVVSAVVVNWIVWPFVARHELRKSLSHMLLNLGIAYRGVVARYIYHDSGYQPTQTDIEMSEIQEAKLREHCFRMRELAEMTRHEICPRAPFDPSPYYLAIDACERFLEHVVEVRRASLYFQPFLLRGGHDATTKMFSARRDAVASILMNLYVLAGALRSKRPVPRYLPSAAAARKRLLDRMAEIEAEYEGERIVTPRPEKSRRWADIYHYAFAAALVDIVAQVELLERLTKVILGEMALETSPVE